MSCGEKGGKAPTEKEALHAQLQPDDLSTTKARVAYILNNFPETRDSDTKLYWRYWNTTPPSVLDLAVDHAKGLASQPVVSYWLAFLRIFMVNFVITRNSMLKTGDIGMYKSYHSLWYVFPYVSES